jgi:uncharacterized SAM-binding protein YcdF (DUF218 family)
MTPSDTKLDAIVVLGCRVAEGALSAPARRRVERGARAFHDGLSTRVIVSGGRRWAGAQEAEEFAAELARLGVPGEAVLREDRSHTTAENARYTAELLGARGARRVAVVTCDWHMARALWLFERAGLVATPVPATSPPVALGKRLSRGASEYGKWCLDRAVTLTW